MTTKLAPKKKVQPKVKRAAIAPAAAKPETVLVLRTCDKDLRAHGGFQWPATGPVAAPDWLPTKECGHGLHGLLWGDGDYGYLSTEVDAKWQVVEVNAADILDLGDKVKFPRGTVLHSGSSREALALLFQGIANRRDSGVATTTGSRSHSSTTGDASHSSTTGDASHSSTTGDASHSSTTGDASHSSTTGDASHSSTTGYASHSSTTGYASHSSTTGDASHSSTTGDASHSSTTGDASHSSTTGSRSHSSTTGSRSHSSTTGDASHSSTTGSRSHSSTTGSRSHSSTTGYASHSSTTGYDAVASCLGYGGSARAHNGVLVLAWHDGKRRRLTVGYTGEDGIEADVDYSVDGRGKFVAVKEDK